MYPIPIMHCKEIRLRTVAQVNCCVVTGAHYAILFVVCKHTETLIDNNLLHFDYKCLMDELFIKKNFLKILLGIVPNALKSKKKFQE